jgi:hypothetical protein
MATGTVTVTDSNGRGSPLEPVKSFGAHLTTDQVSPLIHKLQNTNRPGANRATKRKEHEMSSRTVMTCAPEVNPRIHLIWSKHEILQILADEDPPEEVVREFLLAMYRRQTEDEQDDKATAHRNGQGFNTFDADFLSTVARRAQYRSLTDAELTCVAKSLKKYAGQIADAINNGEIEF